jgi:hypothetical protein
MNGKISNSETLAATLGLVAGVRCATIPPGTHSPITAPKLKLRNIFTVNLTIPFRAPPQA